MDELMSRLKTEVIWRRRELDDLLDGKGVAKRLGARHFASQVGRLRGEIKGLERAQEMAKQARLLWKQHTS